MEERLSGSSELVPSALLKHLLYPKDGYMCPSRENGSSKMGLGTASSLNIVHFPLQLDIVLISTITSGVLLIKPTFNKFGSKKHWSKPQQFLKTQCNYEYLKTLSLDCRSGITCQEWVNWNQICLEFKLAKDGIIKTIKAWCIMVWDKWSSKYCSNIILTTRAPQMCFLKMFKLAKSTHH